MAYRVLIQPHAERHLAKLPPHVAPRIRDAILALGEAPRPPGAKKLRGSRDTWRVRVGDYRVLFVVDDRNAVVHVTAAGHRRDVYER